MFNRVSELSKKTFANGASPSTGDLDADALEPLLGDAEAIQYVLASTDGIEYATDERTTTFEPGDGRQAYAAVSDRRIRFVLGDDPTDPEVSVDLASVASTELKDGLLSATLVVRTADESVRFSPTDPEAAEVAASYAARIGGSWSDLYDSLADAESALDGVAAAGEDGGDPRRAVQRARSRLSNAHHCATQYDDAPTDLMRAEIEPVEARIERYRAETRLESVTEHLDAAEAAADGDDFAAAADAVVEASERLEEARTALEDAGGAADAADEPVADRLAALDDRLTAVADALLAEAEAHCHEALAADDPTDAVAAWEHALERYRTAIAADWDGQAGVSLPALRFQLAWVVGNLIATLADRAAAREAAGDELGEDHDDAADRYEAARDDLVRASDLAAEHPHATDDAFAGRVDDLEQKVERAQWQWGTAD